MAGLNHAEKRNFAKQIATILEQNSELLSNQGFDPSNKLETLNLKLEEAEQAEAFQQQIQAKAKDATKKSVATMTEVYKEASKIVELMAGFLGKDHSLVQELKMLRN